MSAQRRRGQRLKDPLSITHPQLAAEWHPTKNGDLTPDKVVAGSGRKIWWKCPKDPNHEWQAPVDRRTRAKSGCPYCRGLKVSVTNSLAFTFPDLAAEWHPTKNGTITPDKVVAGSNSKVWWRCFKGSDHEWQATVADRTSKDRPTGCPYCAGKKVSVTNSLSSLFPDIATQWHPTKNGHLTPDKVVAGSNKKFWWKCSKGPDHEWQAQLSSRVRAGSGCPCCAGQQVSVTVPHAARTGSSS